MPLHPHNASRQARYPGEARGADAELKEVHPLGKSPVITDGAKTIAESGAIVESRRYGRPDARTIDRLVVDDPFTALR